MRFGPQDAHAGVGGASELAYQLWQRFPKFVLGY